MASGLPLLVADYPETSRLVDRFDVGRTFRPDEPQSIAAAINSLVAHADERDRLARNTQIALTAMDATHEWQRVVSIYADLKRSAAQNAAA
jgi:glycosyltransferase involved in cell wall biosynthesis